MATPIDVLSRYGDETFRAEIASQEFTAVAGQTVFTITTGQYRPNTNTLFISIDGILMPFSSYVQNNPTTFTMNTGVGVGKKVFAYWYVAVAPVTFSEVEQARNSSVKSYNFYNLDSRIESIEQDIENNRTYIGDEVFYSNINTVDGLITALATYGTVVLDVNLLLDREITLDNSRIISRNKASIIYENANASILVKRNAYLDVEDIVQQNVTTTPIIKVTATDTLSTPSNYLNSIINVRRIIQSAGTNVQKSIVFYANDHVVSGVIVNDVVICSYNGQTIDIGMSFELANNNANTRIESNILNNIKAYNVGVVVNSINIPNDENKVSNNVFNDLSITTKSGVIVSKINDYGNNIYNSMVVIEDNIVKDPYIFDRGTLRSSIINMSTYNNNSISKTNTTDYYYIGSFNISTFIGSLGYANLRLCGGNNVVTDITITNNGASGNLIANFSNIALADAFEITGVKNSSSTGLNVFLRLKSSISRDLRVSYLDSFGFDRSVNGVYLFTAAEMATATKIVGTVNRGNNNGITTNVQATLLNGWTGTLYYSVNENKIVTIRGSITAGTIASGTEIFTSSYILGGYPAYLSVRNASILTIGYLLEVSSGSLKVLGTIATGNLIVINSVFSI